MRDAVAELVRDHGPGVDLDTVARRIGTSRRQLQRVFGELSQHGFRATLTAVRMSHARRLLATTDEPIGRIAASVGYGDPAQFSKAFRVRHGLSPRDYRRGARGQAETSRPPPEAALGESL